MASRRRGDGADPFAAHDDEMTIEGADTLLFGDMDTMIDLGDLRLDGGTQPRAKLDETTIQEYADDMARGDRFPPVTVFFDGDDHWLADGFHRVHAARLAGLEKLRADIKQGTRRDAVLFSVGVNAAHGKRRSNEDKRRAISTLLEDEQWSQWSDREIARRCRVHHDTVGRMRRDLSLAESASEGHERTYITKHGTLATMDTSRIAERNRQRAPDEDDAVPAHQETPPSNIGDWEPEAYPTTSPDEQPSTPGHLETFPDGDESGEADVPALTGQELRQVAEALQAVIGAAHTLSSLAPEHLDGLPSATLDGLTDLLVRAGHAMTGTADQRGQLVPGLVDRVETLLDHIDILLYGEG